MDEIEKLQVTAQAETIKSLPDQEKIKKLLGIAKKKGVVYAVNIAKRMNSDFILDTLHDTLAKEGYYKNFKF